MDEFEKKYGFKDDKNRHKKRRMFCIHKNNLFIAEGGMPESHAVWFEKKGWITRENDDLMNEIIRGIVDEKGDIYFYVGYDFLINEKAENIFFPHLKELVRKLNLSKDSNIFGGLMKGGKGQWPPRKKYGKISDN